MNNDYKKLITDIKKDKDLKENLSHYMDYTEEQYNYYCAMKLSMNLYTMCEMCFEKEASGDVENYVSDIKRILSIYVKENMSASEELNRVLKIRTEIEDRMQLLTSFTDGYEIYEYILNRIEAGIKESVDEEISPEQLSAKVFGYVFSENDKVVINSKLQLVMSQLPVRMTKNKFYDVLTNTLSIYKGGDRRAVLNFADMLKKTALIEKPEGFDKVYPSLYETYDMLKSADYKNIDSTTYDKLTASLSASARLIENESTGYILLQEIVNDVYALLLTGNAKKINLAKPAYKAAMDIISVCINENDMEGLDARAMDSFVSIEGVQENIYENIMVLEASSDDIFTGKSDKIDENGLRERKEKIKVLQRLVSTSLFADLTESEDDENQIADGELISDLRNSITQEFAKCFAENPMIVNRSIMSKLFSVMPVFFNSQQEIKDYIDYALCNCNNASELTACNKLLCELIEKE